MKILIIISIFLLTLTTYSFDMITNGSGARIRKKPDTKGKTIISLPVGEKLNVIKKGDSKVKIGKMSFYWYNVKTTEGKTGWVYGSLLTPFDKNSSFEIYDKIIKDRLESKLRYEEYADTVRFINNVKKEFKDNNLVLYLELQKLKLLKLSVSELHKKGVYHKHPWFKENSKELFFHELAGSYYVSSQYVWNLVKKYKKYDAAEDLAWFGTTLALGGECEGYIPCYIGSLELTIGEYLKLYPDGKHSKKAFKSLSKNIKSLMGYIKDGQYDSDKKDLKKSLDSLRALIEKKSTEKIELLNTLDKFEKKTVK